MTVFLVYFLCDCSYLFKGFTFREILGQSLLFFLAAYDTTSTTMSFLIHNLSKHEELQEKLYEEIQDVMEGYVSYILTSARDNEWQIVLVV